MTNFTSFFGGSANLEPKVIQSENDILSASFGQTTVDQWEVGSTVIAADDLRVYNHKVYYAPQAQVGSPVLMDSTPSSDWLQVQDFVFEDASTLAKFSLGLGTIARTKGYAAAGDSSGFEAIVVASGDTDRGITLPNGNVAVPYYDSIIQLSGSDNVKYWLEGEQLTTTDQIRVYNGLPYIVSVLALLPATCGASPDENFQRWLVTPATENSRREDGIVGALDSARYISTLTLGSFDSCYLAINGLVKHESTYNVTTGVIDLLSDILVEGDLWSIVVNTSVGAPAAMTPIVGDTQLTDGITGTYDLPTTRTLSPQAYLVHLNGLHQVPFYDFTIGAGTITFTTIPPINTKIDITAFEPVLNPNLDINNAEVSVVGGTVSRPLASILGDTVNVRDFGAVGDGVTDDSTAFTGAFAFTTFPVFVPVSSNSYVLGGTDDYSSNKSFSYGVVTFDTTSGSTAPTHTNLVP